MAGKRQRPRSLLVVTGVSAGVVAILHVAAGTLFLQGTVPVRSGGLHARIGSHEVKTAWSRPQNEQAQRQRPSIAALGVSLGVVAALVAAGAKRRQVSVSRSAGTLADCPYTVFGNKDIDVLKERQSMEVPDFPLEVHMPSELAGNLPAQQAYFSDNYPKIYKDLKKHGAIVFRGFELSRTPQGFQEVGPAMKLQACEDPLHSVAARDAVNQEAGVYEAVNKPSRRKFYVGMHNEMVGNRAPGAALFVCFKAAEQGGEFLVADGRKMFKDLDPEWVKKTYESEVCYSTAEFPMGFLEKLPWFLEEAVKPVVYGAMQLALRMKVDFETQLVWEKSEYDGSKILQVRAMPQVPVVRHPYTGQPSWWGSVHSHSEFLRREREKVFGDEGFAETTGASRINKTDVYYADTGNKFEVDTLRHVDKVTMESAVPVRMEQGDMVLLDNYLVMHGRCPFEGTRKHAVTWFKSPDYLLSEA